MQLQTRQRETVQPGKWQMLAFASFAAPLTAITAHIAAYLPAYFTQEIGLSLVEVGLVFTMLRVFDIVTDIMFGVAVDRKPFSSGKYRPWILIALPVLMVSSWLLYVPDKDAVNMFYIVVVGVVLYSGYTLAGITHQAWSSEIAKGSNMTVIFGYREYAVILGILGSAIVPMVVELGFQGSFEDKVNSIGYFLVITLPIFGLLCAFSVDDIQGKGESEGSTSTSVSAMLKALKDPSLLKLVVSKACYFIIVSGTGAMAAFLISFAFKEEGKLATSLAIYMVMAFLAVPVWVSIAKKWDEWIALRIACVVGITMHLMVLVALQVGGIKSLLVYYAFAGISFGAGPILLRSMVGKLADHYAENRDTDMRGVMFGLGLFSEKIGSALAIGGSFALLALVGFDPSGANDAQAVNNLIAVYCAFPASAFALIFLITLSKRPDIDWRK